MNDLTGLLLIDKPEGPTSHDMVKLARKTMRLSRVGHTGTLDPFASGLLVLCLGWATRLAEYITPLPKMYRGVIRLGVGTDTDDCTGTVISENHEWRQLREEVVRAALESMVGEMLQRPPAYSAKKVAGRRAYTIARRGSTPQLHHERVTLYRASVTEVALPDVSFEIECSRGTYIRSVARDLGDKLGVGAHLAKLRRLRVGEFSVDAALLLSSDVDEADALARLIEPEAAVGHLERIDLDTGAFDAFGHGRPLPYEVGGGAGPVAVFVDGRLAAIGEARAGSLWPKKVLVGA
ncbi:MAG: tRNA pseudouridine(55) synthase TruB [Gemmatimonadota bacterium]